MEKYFDKYSAEIPKNRDSSLWNRLAEKYSLDKMDTDGMGELPPKRGDE